VINNSNKRGKEAFNLISLLTKNDKENNIEAG
jgi:hypothetical protein